MSAIPIALPETSMRAASCEMLDKLINIGDGDAALLYLYILRHGNGADSETAMRKLKLPAERYERAIFTLSSLNTPAAAAEEDKPDAAPQYTASELRRAREDDHKFSAVCQSAEDTMGHTLTESQLRTLFTAYDHLGLSAGAIIEMLSYLKNEKENVRTPDIRKEAYRWADMGVVSAQDAQDYIARLAVEKPLSEAIYKALDADPQRPAPKAQRVCRFALSHGFPPDAVELAVHRTAVKNGRRSLDYTLGILRRWDEKSVYTVSEITALEPETKSLPVAAAAGESRPTDNSTLELWEKDWLDRVRNYNPETED